MFHLRVWRGLRSHISRVSDRLRYRHLTVNFQGRALRFDSRDFDVPSHSITADAAQYMYDYVLEHGLTHGIEIGSKFGWSGLWIAKALEENGGRLLMVDLKLRGRLVKNFKRADIKNVTLVLGNSLGADVADVVRRYVALHGKFDFAFIDGDHSFEACHSDYKLVLDNAAPVIHIFFDNLWQCPGVRQVFKHEPAADKAVIDGLRMNAPGRTYRECLALHVVTQPRMSRARQASAATRPDPIGAESPLGRLQPAFWGEFLVTKTGKVGEDVIVEQVSL